MIRSKKAKQNFSTHWIIGIVLLMAGFLCFSTLTKNHVHGQSNQANVNVNVATYNALPEYGAGGFSYDLGSGWQGVSGPDYILPGIVGGLVNIRFSTWVYDRNGYDNEIINFQTRLIRTSGAGNYSNTESGGNENDAFYFVAINETTSAPIDGPINCALQSINDYAPYGVNTAGYWNCYFQLPYFADPTTTGSSVNSTINFEQNFWKVLKRATDGITAPIIYQSSQYFEYPNILGLTVDPYINFGLTDNNGTVTAVQAINIENKGNQQLDIALEVNRQTDATAWTCAFGNPLVSDIHHTVNTGDLNYSKMTALTLNLDNTGNQETAFNLIRTTVRTDPKIDQEKFRFATTQPVKEGRCTLSAIVITALQGY